MTVEQAQAALGAVADALGKIEWVLLHLLLKLSASEREDAILEHKAPFDRVTEVRAVIECVLADNVRPGREQLAAVAVVTEKELLARWHETRT